MRIHHVAFRTNDLVRLERFYTGIFGLRPTRRDGERSVWLDADGVILMLEARAPGEPSVATGTNELTCFAIAATERRALERRLGEAGTVVEDATRYTLYFRDPDGRRVGVSSYPDEAI